MQRFSRESGSNCTTSKTGRGKKLDSSKKSIIEMSRLQLLKNSITWLCWVGSSWCIILTGSIVQNIAIRPHLSLSSFIISSSLFRSGFPATFQVWSIAPTYAVHLLRVKYGLGPIKLAQPLLPAASADHRDNCEKICKKNCVFDQTSVSAFSWWLRCPVSSTCTSQSRLASHGKFCDLCTNSCTCQSSF